jgi:periplasmic protein CpxP/Spy
MTRPCWRVLILIPFLGGPTFAAMAATPGPAQQQNAGSAAGDQTPAAPPHTDVPGGIPPPFDPTARIKYLHDRLRIAPDQESLWDDVAQAIRDNVRDIVPLLRERFRSKTNGTALDVLHAYEALGEAELDSLQKFIAAFEPLYKSMSESQKKIADALLRQGPLSSMIGDIPEIPAPFGVPLPYALTAPYYYGPFLRSTPGIPVFGRRHFQPFHGLAAPIRPAPAIGHFGRFHR